MKLTTISLAAMMLSSMPFLAQAQSGSDASAGSSSGAASYSRSGNSGATLNYSSETANTGVTLAQPAYAPDVNVVTSNACALGGGISGGGVGLFSFGAGLSKESKRCGNEVDAGDWAALGDKTMAMAMLCRTPEDAKAYLAAYGTPCPGQPGYVPPTPATNEVSQAPIRSFQVPHGPVTTDELNNMSAQSH